MLYLHDVWVNWFENVENSFDVPHYHEWRKTDQMRLLDQVPVIIVRKELMEYVSDSLNPIPEDLLKKIQGKAFIRRGSRRDRLNHCFILTDGKSVIAVDTDNTNIPLNKSRILPQHTLIAFEMANSHASESFFIPKVEKKPFSLSNPSPEWMVGLTRSERGMKKIFLSCMDDISKKGNKDELTYWITEFSGESFNEVIKLKKTELVDLLHSTVIAGWTDRHKQTTILLSKRNRKAQKAFEMEVKYSKGLRKVSK